MRFNYRYYNQNSIQGPMTSNHAQIQLLVIPKVYSIKIKNRCNIAEVLENHSSPCISSIFHTNLLKLATIPPKFSKYLYNILSTSQYFRHVPNN